MLHKFVLWIIRIAIWLIPYNPYGENYKKSIWIRAKMHHLVERWCINFKGFWFQLQSNTLASCSSTMNSQQVFLAVLCFSFLMITVQSNLVQSEFFFEISPKKFIDLDKDLELFYNLDKIKLYFQTIKKILQLYPFKYPVSVASISLHSRMRSAQNSTILASFPLLTANDPEDTLLNSILTYSISNFESFHNSFWIFYDNNCNYEIKERICCPVSLLFGNRFLV